MEHSFDVYIARDYGIAEAIVLKHIYFWVCTNRTNKSELHYHQGKYWMFNSKRTFAEVFVYLTEKQVRRVLDSLVKHGLIEKGNFNKKLSRTLWYTVTEKTIKLFNGYHWPKEAKLLDQTGQTIGPEGPKPYIYTDDNTTDVIPSFPEMENPTTFFSKNIGKATPHVQQKIKLLQEEYGEERLLEVMKFACENGGKSIAYVERRLRTIFGRPAR